MPKLVYLRRLWVLMATIFVDMMGNLIVIPLLPFYAKEYQAADWEVGWLIASFALAQLVTAPLWGRLSDHWGRRPVILWSLVISAAAFVVFALAESVWLLLISRLVQGVGGGTIGVVQAYVSDVVPPKARTQALGWVTVATSAGVMIGPAVGSWATLISDQAPGFVAAGLCLMSLLFAYVYLGEAEEHDEPEQTTAKAAEEPRPRTPLGTALFRIILHPTSPVSRLIWVYAISMMAFMAMNGMMVLYLDRVFGIGKESIGYFYVYVGAISLLMRALLLGPLVNRLGEARTMRLGALSLLLGFLTLPLASNLWLLALTVLLIPVGTSLLFPATTSMVSQHSPRRETGQSLGVQQAFGGVSRVLGPLWSTAAFQYLAIASTFWINAALMGIVLLIAAGMHEVGAAPRRLPALEPE